MICTMRDETDRIILKFLNICRVPCFLCAAVLFASLVCVASGAIAVSAESSQAIVENVPVKPQEILELPAVPENTVPAPAAKPQPAMLPPTLPAAGQGITQQALPGANPSIPVIPAMPGSGNQVKLPQKPDIPGPDIPSQENNNIAVLPIPKASAENIIIPGTVPVPVDSKAQADYNTNMTLMFSGEEMAVLAQIIKAYDSYEPNNQNTQAKDDVKDILTGLSDKSVTANDVMVPQNLYLAGIVYYSSSNWLVTLNGRIITSSSNAPGNEFYVSQISRKEIELIWKPVAPTLMGELLDKWNQLTDNGKKTIANITISNGTIKLKLHPNQTFVPTDVAIREGLVRPGANARYSQPRNDIITNPPNNAPENTYPAHKGG